MSSRRCTIRWPQEVSPAWNVSELSVRPLRKGGGGGCLSAGWPRPDLFWLLFTQPAACAGPETIAGKLPERQQAGRVKLADDILGIRLLMRSTVEDGEEAALHRGGQEFGSKVPAWPLGSGPAVVAD